MIKVKDGYAKLIGTTYQGSATQVLLSNGGDLEYSASSKASTLVQRNASQHIYATYFNSAISDEALTDIGSVYVRNTSDTFIRRVSKTQFYSILDDKFVTLDTTQSITGAKTFSTSVRFANNASIIQNQNDTSNYTTILKWYKNGASRNTYDPSIGQHNTGGDGNGSICILPYPTATSPQGGTVGLFISKGVLKLDGKSVALAENYYTKTESDERYVNVTGDTMTGPLIVKAAITGTQLISTIATGTSPLKVTSTTVVTNLNSDLLDGLHETSFFRARGSQSIASSIPTTTELSTNNNLCGSWNVSYTGASGHLVQFNTGSGSTRYMQFYSMYSGSLYWRNSTDSTLNTKSWKTIVDSANYTGIVLKIGTATKGSATLPIYLNAGTPTACSTTLGVSITGNAATANRILSHTISDTLANKTTPGYLYHAGDSNSVADKPSGVDAFGVFTMQTASGWYGQILMSSNTSTGLYWRTATTLSGGWKKILDSSNYTAYINPANFVTALGTNGNYLTWTKNGTVNNLTVPFATSSNILNNLGNKTAISGTTLGDSGLRLYRVYSNGYPTIYGNLLNIGGAGYGELLLGWTRDSNPGHLYYRSKRDVASQAWSSWVTVLDSGNYTGTLDARYVTLATTQTISGVKTFTTQQKFTVATGTSPFTVSSTTVVSNLNADMLDGYHRSNLYSGIDAWIGAVGLTKTISVTGSSSTWYPVVISVSSSKRMPTRISIHKNLGSTTPAISGNHSNGTSSMWLIYEMRYTGWDGNGGFCRTLYRSMPYASLCAHTRTNTQNSGSLIVWLRGGTCSYDISCTNSFTVNIYYSTTNISGISGYTDNVAPMTSTDNLGLYNTHHRYYVQASSVVGTITFAAGAFAAKTYNGSAAVTVNIPTHTSHLTNNSGFWTGTRYWANIAVSTASSTGTSPTFSSVYLGSRLYLNNNGINSIYCGPNDAANTIGGALNNLVFSSWCGVSFTTSCAGQTCTDKNAVSINCRTGQLNAYQVYANGFHHRSMDSNSYVLLAGGSYKALTDFVKGNAGSATKGVYVTGGTITAMTYSLSANLNSGTAGRLATYSSGTTVAAYNSTVGASNRGIYMSSGVPTAMTYYLNSTVNSGTSGKLAYYSGATTVASYSTTLGNAWTPVYMNAGVPTTCSYSFCGGYSQPIVLLAGTIYRGGNSSNYWYFTGTKHFAISGMNSSISINGGVACFTFNASSGRSFTIYGAIANHQASTKMTSYTSGESGNIRSDGLYWFGTYTSSHNVYIRACCNANSDNDSTQTRPGAWQTWSGAVTRLSIVLIGYAY